MGTVHITTAEIEALMEKKKKKLSLAFHMYTNSTLKAHGQAAEKLEEASSWQ